MSSAAATRPSRPAVVRYKARFTVSLIEVVPSSALAALRASSSKSIRCFATKPVYTSHQKYISRESVRRVGKLIPFLSASGPTSCIPG